MHSSLEPSPYGSVELPGDVGRAEYKNAFGVAAYTVHLYEELRFYTARGFRFTFSSGPTEGIDFVDEYY